MYQGLKHIMYGELLFKAGQIVFQSKTVEESLANLLYSQK